MYAHSCNNKKWLAAVGHTALRLLVSSTLLHTLACEPFPNSRTWWLPWERDGCKPVRNYWWTTAVYSFVITLHSRIWNSRSSVLTKGPEAFQSRPEEAEPHPKGLCACHMSQSQRSVCMSQHIKPWLLQPSSSKPKCSPLKQWNKQHKPLLPSTS